jgi:methionyl-tRNA synthetase
MSRPYYVTTPIYYVNDVPHIGHSYTTIAADVLARYFRAAGRDVRFLTGTDEHGIKIVKAAREKHKTPRELADEVVVQFQDLWRALDISYDDFIRTSAPRHEKRVQEIIRRLVAADEIYRGEYQGWYDETQEEFVTESAARAAEYRSEISGRALTRYSESAYFFRLGKWIPRLREHIEAHPAFIRPEARRNEVLSKLAAGVDDLCISRALDKLGDWGVPMPNDPTHSVYVWIDALSNYCTALGWPAVGDDDDERHERYWPADVHLIGKDILWFHAVYWPCLLMALGRDLPRCVFAHGWWTSEGKRMQKTLGNFISREQIAEICDEYSVDVYRYFLLRAMAFGADGDFSRDTVRRRYNDELANGVGNLLSRTVNMIGRYFDGRVPAAAPPGEAEREVLDAAQRLRGAAGAAMEACQFHAYLDAVSALEAATNRYIDATAPFRLAKDPARRERVGAILNTCAASVRQVLLHLAPVMPQAAVRGLEQLGGDASVSLASPPAAWGDDVAGAAVRAAEALFPRKAP